mmetsp:Transcript_27647/g.60208  ORF Transcript_27647/g.60208 Transcript_27647/m.60208 type:complete len:211 (-) Transcript_27647:3-635(-)
MENANAAPIFVPEMGSAKSLRAGRWPAPRCKSGTPAAAVASSRVMLPVDRLIATGIRATSVFVLRASIRAKVPASRSWCRPTSLQRAGFPISLSIGPKWIGLKSFKTMAGAPRLIGPRLIGTKSTAALEHLAIHSEQVMAMVCPMASLAPPFRPTPHRAPMLTPTPMACHTGDDRSEERSFWLLASEGLEQRSRKSCARSLVDMPSLIGS